MIPLDGAWRIVTSGSGGTTVHLRTRARWFDAHVEFKDAFLSASGWLRIERPNGEAILYPPSAVQRIDLRPEGD